MNRNTNTRFSTAPLDIDIQRSRFHRPSTHKTTFNAADLIPIYVDEVLPGDTFNMTMASLCRMTTPIFPVMDDCWLDTFFFYVPNRLLWDHWKEFMGENNVSAWTSDVVYEIPTLDKSAAVKGFKFASGGVGDHMGIIPNRDFLEVSALPLRAYRLIWNEWFRDQNLQDPLLVNTGDIELDATLDNLLKACKPHDYFTSALPAPQKAPDVLIPGLDYIQPMTVIDDSDIVADIEEAIYNSPYYMGLIANATPGIKVAAQTSTNPGYLGVDGTGNLRVQHSMDFVPTSSNAFFGSFYGLNVRGTVNQLRTAFQIQKLYERDARSGSRYVESIKSHFGVTAPDASLQRPQYLGGERININVNQVVQTSATDDTSPQGNVAAFSKTVSRGHIFDQSFYEHGYIIGLACVRTAHTYQQGVNKMWTRKTRLDFYTPELANIGEQPILNKEIYVSYLDPAQSAWDPENDEVFGYQEAWADYRYKPSIVTGSFRSSESNGPSLDPWTYADFFESRPYLSAEFIEETDKNIERTLAVGSDLADQFLLDMYFDLYVDRPMPVYSVPGLADHH